MIAGHIETELIISNISFANPLTCQPVVQERRRDPGVHARYQRNPLFGQIPQ